MVQKPLSVITEAGRGWGCKRLVTSEPFMFAYLCGVPQSNETQIPDDGKPSRIAINQVFAYMKPLYCGGVVGEFREIWLKLTYNAARN